MASLYCIWPANHDLQPLQQMVKAPYLATHLREDGGGRSCSGGIVHRQQLRQSASLGSWLKKGEYAEAIGRSRGGRTSKIHALADDQGRPAAFALTPGNVADITMAIPLLEAVTSPKANCSGPCSSQSVIPARTKILLGSTPKIAIGQLDATVSIRERKTNECLP